MTLQSKQVKQITMSRYRDKTNARPAHRHLRTIVHRLTTLLIALVIVSHPVAAKEFTKELTWDDLIFEGFSLEVAPVNEELDGKMVKIPGYVVPLEMDGEMVSEFLLVPYAGACIHTPPPPTNQIVHVIAAEPFKSMMHRQPVWSTGLIKINKSVSSVGYYSAESSYQMTGAEVKVYGQ